MTKKRINIPWNDKSGKNQSIPGYLFDIPELTSNDRVLLAFIINTTKGGDGCRMSKEGLAQRFGLSFDIVKNSFRKFRELGLIQEHGSTSRRVVKAIFDSEDLSRGLQTPSHDSEAWCPETPSDNPARCQETPSLPSLVSTDTETWCPQTPHNKKELLVNNSKTKTRKSAGGAGRISREEETGKTTRTNTRGEIQFLPFKAQ